MYRIVVLIASLTLCYGHAVPVVAPLHHTAVVTPVVGSYGGHGYGGNGLGGYGYGGLGYGALEHGGFGHGGLGYGSLGYAGYGGIGGHGYSGHGLLSHGLLAKPVGHHILKRSPHLVTPLAHVAHVAPLAHVAPVAVSHQSRLDVHSSPAIIATSVVQPVVAPVLHAAPLLHKSFIAGPLHFGGGIGGGHYGHGYGHY